MGCFTACSTLCPESMEAFTQQRLSAWAPRRAAGDNVKWCAAIGVIFAILSIVIMVSDRQASEFVWRYDQINNCTAEHHQSAFSYEGNNMSKSYGCKAEIVFTLQHRMKAPVFLYYGLKNVYQNHRRYLSSQSTTQLRGFPLGHGDRISTSPLCFPNELAGGKGEDAHIEINGVVHSYRECTYSPAGVIAWSMFNDTFTLYKRVTKPKLDKPIIESGKNVSATTFRKNNNCSNEQNMNKNNREEISEVREDTVDELICNGSAFSRATNELLSDAPTHMHCHKKGIAWTSDVAKRFKPILPPPPTSQTEYHDKTKVGAIHQPSDLIWSAPKDIYYHWPSDRVPRTNDSFYNNGWYANELGHDIPVITDEDFMVWSRVAARHSFRKLYRVIDVDLEPGEYVMHIDEHYNVHSFHGAKFFALATLTWKGNKSEVLMYIFAIISILGIVNCFFFMCWQCVSEKFALRAIARLQREEPVLENLQKRVSQQISSELLSILQECK